MSIKNIRDVTIKINSRTFRKNDGRGNWVSIVPETGFFYISMHKSGRYYFVLPNVLKKIKKIILDDEKKSVSFELSMTALQHESGKAWTGKFKLIFDKNNDYKKAKYAFLTHVFSKTKVKGDKTIPSIKKRKSRSKRKSKRTSHKKSRSKKR